MPQEDTAHGKASSFFGEVSMRAVDVSYTLGDKVIDGLSLHIPAGQKLGIVGRTGAGKSTLVRAITRLTRLSGGVLCIDGQDISTLGLHSLRSQIAVLSQQPHLFGGTVRFNLDPAGGRPDAELWAALQKARCSDLVAQRLGGLDGVISSGGCNLSAGQGQLICLARVLLADCPLILLDEATASLDAELSQLVEAVLTAEARDATVVHVAHRLAAVGSADRIVVMEAGRIAEDGQRAELLGRQTSLFYRLARDERHARGRSRGDRRSVVLCNINSYRSATSPKLIMCSCASVPMFIPRTVAASLGSLMCVASPANDARKVSSIKGPCVGKE